MPYSAILPEGNTFHFWEKDCEYTTILHVDANAPHASDNNDGSPDKPFCTINAAAKVATPGTKVLIHAGVYHECVRPAMGGTDAQHMIAYEAAGDGDVIISASEEVTDFFPSTDWRLGRIVRADVDPCDRKIWGHELDPDMFRGYNPFCAVNIIHDRLFIEYEKTDMTTYLNRRGCIFCDGKPLTQVALYNGMTDQDGTYWVEANGQTIHFRLPGDADPKDHKIEITVREQCFAPKTPFLNYIKLKGLICQHAATGAPVPQRGAISANRGHHWVVEDCQVNWSNALAMDFGNECWHHYHNGDETIGHSVVRGCTIRDAGVCGIAGIYATHMLIEDTVIEGTGWQKMELSWEAACIKLHDTVDTLIRNNIFRNTFRADHIWLDCNNENNRITGNLFIHGIEQREAIFIECTREGINLIDNNIIWDVPGRFDPAQVPDEPGSKGWYKLCEHEYPNGYGIYAEGTDRLYIAHNLIGKCRHSGYYAKPVPFRMHDMLRGGTSRKAKVFNNIFYDCGEAAIVFPTIDNESEGNVFANMQGGFLRVMYPAPQTNLNLRAWREFNGFDLTGQNAYLDIQVDEEKGTVTFSPQEEEPFGNPGPKKWNRWVQDPKLIEQVVADAHVPADAHGTPHGEKVLPGPFATLTTPPLPGPKKK